MSPFDKLLFAVLSVSFCLSATQLQHADARGGGGYREPKPVREPGLWYGDSYVPEDIKTDTYSNYRGTANATTNYGSNNNYHGTSGNASPYGVGNPQYTTPGPSPQFSGPAHIVPEQYHYFVQEYHWEKR